MVDDTPVTNSERSVDNLEASLAALPVDNLQREPFSPRSLETLPEAVVPATILSPLFLEHSMNALSTNSDLQVE